MHPVAPVAPVAPVISAQPALCVSLHDVAPANWPQCQRLIAAVEAVASIPLTLLVVPDYHRQPVRDAAAWQGVLEGRLARGDELALHGYTHLDEGPPAIGLRARWQRHVYTLNEGEFAALEADEAARRLQLGLEWFGARGWPVHGFVAPAWLLSEGSRRALRGLPFTYTTTLNNFYLLPHMQGLLSPTLVYSARNAPGRWLSRHWNDFIAREMQHMPLLRFGLHPADAQHPAQIAHCQALLAQLVQTHRPMTKATFAQQWLT